MYSNTRLAPSAIHAPVTSSAAEAQSAPARKPFPAPGLALVLGLTLKDYVAARGALRNVLATEAAEVRKLTSALRGQVAEAGIGVSVQPLSAATMATFQSQREAARHRARAAHLALSALRGRDLRDVEQSYHHACPTSAIQAALVLALPEAPIASPAATKAVARWCAGTPVATLQAEVAQATAGT